MGIRKQIPMRIILFACLCGAIFTTARASTASTQASTSKPVNFKMGDQTGSAAAPVSLVGTSAPGSASCPTDGMRRADGIALQRPEDEIASAAIDPEGGYAYFGTRGSPGKIIKVNLSDLSRVQALTLNAEGGLYSAVIDPAGGYAYFGTRSWNAKVVKVRLSDFTLVEERSLPDSA